MKLIRRKGKGDLPGSIYRPKYRDKNGNLVESLVYWVKYYKDGKPLRESTKKTEYDEAVTFLADRVADVKKGKTPNIQLNKIKWDELKDDFLLHYRIKNQNLARAQTSINALEPFFSGILVVNITTTKVREYIQKRMDDGVQNSTINRELAALKKMLNLGYKHTPPKVDRVPYIEMMKEAPPRKGFAEHDYFLKFRDALPDFQKGYVTFLYKSGWRTGVARDLQWTEVDLERRRAWVNRGDGKTEEPQILILDDELMEVLRAQFTRLLKSGNSCPYVFPDRTGTRRMGDVRKTWAKAFKEAKIEPIIPHDFRRTAVRNNVRAGVPDKVSMRISGHKTRSIFDRYNIVSEDDLEVAAAKQQAYLKSIEAKMGKEAAVGKETGKVAELNQRSKPAKLDPVSTRL